MYIMRFVVLAMLIVFVSGCETVPAEKDQVRAKVLMVIPLQTMHKELQTYAKPLEEGVEKKLKAKDFVVKMLPLADFETMKGEAFSVSGSVYDPALGYVMPLNQAVFTKAFIDAVRKKYAFDVIVFPEFVSKTSRVNGDDVEFDGVVKEVEWVETPKEPFLLPDRVSALSLKLSVFTDSGVKINTYFGGVCLPYHLTLHNGKIGYQLKSPIVTNKELKASIDLSSKKLLQQVVYDEKHR